MFAKALDYKHSIESSVYTISKKDLLTLYKLAEYTAAIYVQESFTGIHCS